MSDFEQIATFDLNTGNVPVSETASRRAIEEFCLTFDGYEGGRRTIDDLLELADRVERGGLEQAHMEDLRSVAFVRQRELRWSDQGGSDERLLRQMRAAVAEIRRRVELLSTD